MCIILQIQMSFLAWKATYTGVFVLFPRTSVNLETRYKRIVIVSYFLGKNVTVSLVTFDPEVRLSPKIEEGKRVLTQWF